MRVLIALLGNAVALYATTLVPGITFRGSVLTLIIAGLLFGLFNATVRPLVMLLSLPLVILTLGLFYFVLNGLLLWLASALLPGYEIAGFIPALLGSLVIAVVNGILSLFARR